jgi:hypothetical protein
MTCQYGLLYVKRIIFFVNTFIGKYDVLLSLTKEFFFSPGIFLLLIPTQNISLQSFSNCEISISFGRTSFQFPCLQHTTVKVGINLI